MSSPKLTPFSYVVLTLVGESGAGPHDLVRMMRDGRVYWTAPESQFYAEPKKLAQAGYLRRDQAAGPDPRPHALHAHRRTDAAALKAWLATPTRFPRIQNEPVVRLLGREYADRGELLASLNALRKDLDELDAALQAAEQREQGASAPRNGSAPQPPPGATDPRRPPPVARGGRSRAVKVPLQRFRSNGASVDSRIGAVSLPRGGPVR